MEKLKRGQRHDNDIVKAIRVGAGILREYNGARHRLHTPCMQWSHLACVVLWNVCCRLLWCFPAALQICRGGESVGVTLAARDDGYILVLTMQGVCGYDSACKPVAIDWGGVDEQSIRLLCSEAKPPQTGPEGFLPALPCCSSRNSNDVSKSGVLEAAAAQDGAVPVGRSIRRSQAPSLTCGVGVGLGAPCYYRSYYHEHCEDTGSWSSPAR